MRSARRMGEWLGRAMAVAALFVAFRPGSALAASTALPGDEGYRASAEDFGAGVVVEIDVEDESPPGNE